MTCPLCAAGVRPFARAHGRTYHECPECRLVAMDAAHRPTPEAERAHYGTHRNDPADPGYRRFLDRLCAPLVSRLPPGAEGLDYGAGPGPTLSRMLEERGFPTTIYDPFFAPDAGALARAYDFATCTEAAEHFHAPAAEFARLDALLRPGGWLGVMTEMLDDARDFHTWRYARDPTHVCFYRAETMRWLAARHAWTMESPARGVVLFQKVGAGEPEALTPRPPLP